MAGSWSDGTLGSDRARPDGLERRLALAAPRWGRRPGAARRARRRRSRMAGAAARREEHRAADGGGPAALPGGQLDARHVRQRSAGGKAACARLLRDVDDFIRELQKVMPPC